MAEIIYFGTNGCSGHSPIGIDKTLTRDEYKIWCECDNDAWINNIRKNPGRHLIMEKFIQIMVFHSLQMKTELVTIPNCFGKAFIQKKKLST